MGQLWRVGMDGTMTKFGPQMDLSPAGMLMGVAVDEQGRVFVALNNFGSDYGMAEDPPSGVLRVTPGNARRVLTLPVDAVPNGLAEHEGRLYVTDSFGSIWTGSTTGAPEQADRWFHVAAARTGLGVRHGSQWDHLPPGLAVCDLL